MSVLLLAAYFAAVSGAAVPAGYPCARVVGPLVAGTVITSADVALAACAAKPARLAFRYDASLRAVRAARDLAPGELVPGLPAATLPTVRPGQVIVLAVRVGAVVLSRTVVALQPARPGQKLFVRAADGRTFPVDCPVDCH